MGVAVYRYVRDVMYSTVYYTINYSHEPYYSTLIHMHILMLDMMAGSWFSQRMPLNIDDG